MMGEELSKRVPVLKMLTVFLGKGKQTFLNELHILSKTFKKCLPNKLNLD